MSKFWAKSWRHRVSDESRFFVKQPASAAHTYGRRLVAAEGFITIGPHWQETLWDNLKPSNELSSAGAAAAHEHLACCAEEDQRTGRRPVPACSRYRLTPPAAGWDRHLFVSNQQETPATLQAMFRVAGRQPEFWDPVTGKTADAAAFRFLDQRTAISLHRPPYGSTFVVFRRPVASLPGAMPETNKPMFSRVGQLSGPWEVSFDPRWGGPEKVTFETLEDWTSRPEEGIKYYSGTAVYRRIFDLPQAVRGRAAERRLFLDLGTVKQLAEVRLNGRELGVVWCPRWRVEITDAIREKGNRLEIEVVNFWPNRVIGDAALPPEQRRTSTNITKLTADTPLMSSGLLGPVMILKKE